MATAPWLLEASWEVCNKVGGIHTVITSKLPWTKAQFNRRYLAVGPYLGSCDCFKAKALPRWLKGPAEELARRGITLHYGIWQVAEKPPTILLDWQGLLPELNTLKGDFWQQFSLDSLGSDFYQFDQPLLWGYCVGLLAAALNFPLILQLHEWLAGGALFATLPSSVQTVFTTHATVIGRARASQGLIGNQEVDPLSEAKRLGVHHKHQLESLTARRAKVFTTVSELTAAEASRFLGRKPDILTENGLELELPANRAGHFHRILSKQLGFDTEQAFIAFTMGRYELTAKGYDVFLAALGKLNRRLPAGGRPLVGLFMIPAEHGPLLNQAGQLSPFELPEHDPIQRLASQNGLTNQPENLVQLLFLPTYLDGRDGFLNLSIYEAVSCCQLGVFPSLYEPWGYTPLESLALGVPAISSSLAGFGQAAKDQAGSGLAVLDRASQTWEDSAEQLAAMIEQYYYLDGRGIAKAQAAARKTSLAFSWRRLYSRYKQAYQLALN